ncbi:hypothetical protein H4Q32_023631 [Labeo rohita]|uniref:Uncharacterized protein n=1 Tax=Labeo rohita TaxID=84645 RepID=A0ABQ8M8Y9_LABRO|nr:hypothetical protein H4Q32_023631 [Labeo rohita]
MLWAKGILLFTMAVTMLSSLRADPEAFSETGAISGAISKTTIHFGKLLIGGQGTASDSEIKTSDLMSTDSDEYQSNEEAQFRLAKAKLRRLGPSVHCSNDSMTLHIPGPRTPHFLVDRGDESPVPLSQMPASCGFSLKRARRDVSLVAPYQGCHVRQQDLELDSALLILVDGSWQPLLLTYSKCSFTLETTGGSLVVTAPFTGSCWEVKDTERHLPLMYGDREVTLSCPLTLPAPTTIAPTAAPTIPPTLPGHDPIGMPNMFYPFPFGRPWWQQPYFPGYPGVQPVPATQPPTTTTTTTTTPLPQDPVPHVFPQMPMFDPYYFSLHGAPAPRPPYPWYPMFPHMYGFQSPAEPTTVATTTTTPPTTTTAAQIEQQAAYPMFPMFYGSQPIKSYEPPAVKYPFMPSYPQYPVFGPRSPKSVSSPAQLSSIYRSRRHQLKLELLRHNCEFCCAFEKYNKLAMLWAKGILLFTMAVTMLSSLRADPEAFSETGATSGVVSETAIHFGKLLIGGQGAASDSEIKTSDLTSTDSNEYQSNEEARFRLAKAKLRSLGPSVHCSNDSMTLHIPGPRTPHFLVDRDASQLWFFTEAGTQRCLSCCSIPGMSCPTTGWKLYSATPYNGSSSANVLPHEFSPPYSVLLLLWHDHLTWLDGSWQPLLLTYSKCSFTLETTGGSLVVTAPFTGSCWEVKDTERHLPLMYGDREVTLSCPLTLPAPTTIAPTAAPTIPPTLPGYDPIGMPNMFYPFPFGRPWWQQPYFPGYPGVQPVPATQPPTTTTTTTTTPPPQDPVPQMFPHMHHMPMFDPYYFSPPGALAPQQPYPWYPMFPHMYGFQSPAEPTTAATTTTTPPTTTTAAQFEQQAAYPMFPMFYGSQPIKSYEPPAVKYPFMPSYPQYPVFGPRSPKSMSSPAQLSSIHRSRRHQLEVR